MPGSRRWSRAGPSARGSPPWLPTGLTPTSGSSPGWPRSRARPPRWWTAAPRAWPPPRPWLPAGLRDLLAPNWAGGEQTRAVPGPPPPRGLLKRRLPRVPPAPPAPARTSHPQPHTAPQSPQPDPTVTLRALPGDTRHPSPQAGPARTAGIAEVACGPNLPPRRHRAPPHRKLLSAILARGAPGKRAHFRRELRGGGRGGAWLAEGSRGRGRRRRFCSGGGGGGGWVCGAMSYVPGQPVTAVVVRRDEPESGSGGRAAGFGAGGGSGSVLDHPGRRSGRRVRSLAPYRCSLAGAEPHRSFSRCEIWTEESSEWLRPARLCCWGRGNSAVVIRCWRNRSSERGVTLRDAVSLFRSRRTRFYRLWATLIRAVRGKPVRVCP